MGRRPTAEAKPDDIDPALVVPRETMARIFGLTSASITKLVGQGMPRVARGQYSIPHCVQFYVDLWRPSGRANGGDPTDKEGLDLRSRLTLAQAEKYELVTEIARGHYAPVETVEHAMSEAAASLAASLDGLGARLAGVLADETEPAQVQATIVSEVRSIREDYANNLAAWADEVAGPDPAHVPDAGGDTAPPKGQNGGSMG